MLELARRLLEWDGGIVKRVAEPNRIQLEGAHFVPMRLGDHYEHGEKTVRLSSGNHDGGTSTTITVVA